MNRNVVTRTVKKGSRDGAAAAFGLLVAAAIVAQWELSAQWTGVITAIAPVLANAGYRLLRDHGLMGPEDVEHPPPEGGEVIGGGEPAAE